MTDKVREACNRALSTGLVVLPKGLSGSQVTETFELIHKAFALGRQHGMEEAAEVCERAANGKTRTVGDRARNGACDSLAEMIRARAKGA